MAGIDVTVPHHLGTEGAKTALQNLLLSYRGKASKIKLVEATWVEAGSCLNFTLDYEGKHVTGTAVVAPSYVRVSTEALPVNFLTGLFVVPYISASVRSALLKALG